MVESRDSGDDEGRSVYTDLSLIHVVLVAMLFLYVTGDYLFGSDWPGSGALLYAVMVLSALSMTQLVIQTVPLTEQREYLGRLVPLAPISHGVVHWLGGFGVTYAVVLTGFQLAGYEWPDITQSEATAMLYFTVVFVAPAEELLFRGVLPNLHYERRVLGVPLVLVASQALFSVFHVAAYGGIGAPMIITFVLGVAWVFVARWTSLFTTMGSHAAYNLCVLGVLTGGVT